MCWCLDVLFHAEIVSVYFVIICLIFFLIDVMTPDVFSYTFYKRLKSSSWGIGFIWSWEMFFYQFENYFAKDCFEAFIIQWIERNNISFPAVFLYSFGVKR